MDKKDTIKQKGPVEIKDEKAKKWYDTGFTFAVNYLLAWIEEESDKEFNKEEFRNLVSTVIGDEVIDEKYFEKLHFYQGDNRYGSKCPDPEDPNVCISCTGSMVQAIPKP